MFKKVLVPVDLQDTEFSVKTLKIAMKEVIENGGQLHIITVLPGFINSYVSSYLGEQDHQDAVKNAAKDLKHFAVTNVDDTLEPVLKVFEGSASEEINRYVRKQGIELVVIRAHQRSKINEFLLGSVSARVVERAYCSVFVVKD
ncbi:universal stress protein [Gammaproteobacteria bacterium AS21]|jgi:nucleotide-binding universal stress UspA family protein